VHSLTNIRQLISHPWSLVKAEEGFSAVDSSFPLSHVLYLNHQLSYFVAAPALTYPVLSASICHSTVYSNVSVMITKKPWIRSRHTQSWRRDFIATLESCTVPKKTGSLPHKIQSTLNPSFHQQFLLPLSSQLMLPFPFPLNLTHLHHLKPGLFIQPPNLFTAHNLVEGGQSGLVAWNTVCSQLPSNTPK